MKHKYFFTSILIFATILLFCFSAKSQATSDTITVVKKGNGLFYYYQDKSLLNFNQIMDLTKDNQTSNALMRQSYNLRSISKCFYVAGGVSFGFSLGYFIVGAIYNNIKMGILLPSMGSGVGLLVCGGICELFSNEKRHKGIKIYNNAIKQKNSTYLGLDVSPNGMSLRLNF